MILTTCPGTSSTPAAFFGSYLAIAARRSAFVTSRLYGTSSCVHVMRTLCYSPCARQPAPAKALRRSASCHLHSYHTIRLPLGILFQRCAELPLFRAFTAFDRSSQPPSRLFELVYQASVVSTSCPCPLSSSS